MDKGSECVEFYVDQSICQNVWRSAHRSVKGFVTVRPVQWYVWRSVRLSVEESVWMAIGVAVREELNG